MFGFKYWYCKLRMVAYLNGELPPVSRQRVARFIDDCPDCYREYVRQRDLRRELTNVLPRFGQPEPGQLDRIWANIQADMRPNKPTGRTNRYFQARYGLATLLLVVALVLPYLISGQQVSRAAVTQPTPRTVVQAATNSPDEPVPFAPVTAQPVRANYELTANHQNAIIPQAAQTPAPPEIKSD